MASLQKRTLSTGGYVYYVDFRYGRTRHRISTGTANKAQATQILIKIQSEIVAKKFRLEDYIRSTRDISLRDLAKAYHDNHSLHNKVQGSRDIDRQAMDDLMYLFGSERTARSIKPSDAVRFQNWLRSEKVRTTQRTYGDGRTETISITDENGNEIHGIAPATVNIKTRALRAIFNWAKHENQGFIDRNPFEGLKQIQSEKKTVFTMNPSELRAILEQAQKDRRQGKKFILFTSLLFNSACRRKELIEMKWEQVNFVKREIRFTKTKGKKDRILPINDEMMKILKEVYDLAEDGRDPSSRLFKWSKDKPTKLFSKYKKAAGLRKELKLHSFRHTAARSLLEAGVNVMDIKEILGHSDVKTTEGYLKSFPVALRKALDATSLERFVQG